MNEKPLCGYCYKEYRKDCCDKQTIDRLNAELEEAREEELKLLQEVEPVFSNFDSSPCRLEDDEPVLAQIWYNVLNRILKLKEQEK